MININILVFLSSFVLQFCEVFGCCPPGIMKFPSPDNSNTFYLYHSEGTSTYIECPPANIYNPSSGQCEFKGHISTTAKYQGDSETGNYDTNNHYLIRTLLVKCPDGMNYNSKIGTCESSRRVHIEATAKTIDIDCTFNTNKRWPKMYQNFQDCSTYYICNQGQPVLTYCPRGLNFNPTRGGCDDSPTTGCKPKLQQPVNYQVYE